MSMRITTSMLQRNVLADLNRSPTSSRQLQMKSASGKEITRPSDDPFHAARGAWRCAQSLERHPQYQRNVAGRAGLGRR